jgi:hypothetical protein
MTLYRVSSTSAGVIVARKYLRRVICSSVNREEVNVAPEARSSTILGCNSPRFVFACGTTGGHVLPAIAVAEEIIRMAPSSQVA